VTTTQKHCKHSKEKITPCFRVIWRRNESEN